MKIILLQKICGILLFYKWLQSHLISCPFKSLTGIDCPGCGFQRSTLALLEGRFVDSFILYPPLIPILLFGCYCIADSYFKVYQSKPKLKRNLFLLVGTIVLISYSLKMWGLYHGYITSAFAAI
jgi:hypothetical protein